MLPPSEFAARLRASTDEAERLRLRERLAASVRSLAVRTMESTCRYRNQAPGEIEDGAQELVLTLVDQIFHGRQPPRPGSEDPFVTRCAQNAAKNILVGKGVYRYRRYEAQAPADKLWQEPSFADAADAQAQREALSGVLHECLAELNESYREVLAAYHLREEPIGVIAQRWVDEGRATDLKKATQNIHAACSRGMRALKRLANARQEAQDA